MSGMALYTRGLGRLVYFNTNGYNKRLDFYLASPGIWEALRGNPLIHEETASMRHYEIVFMVHPDQSEQVPAMVERYRSLVEDSGGQVHRQEDWGRRQLAFPIDKVAKAHYILMNIECDGATLKELEGIFKFNDAVARHMTVRKDHAVTEPSVMMRDRKDEEDNAKPRRHDDDKPAREESDKPAAAAKSDGEDAAAAAAATGADDAGADDDAGEEE